MLRNRLFAAATAAVFTFLLAGCGGPLLDPDVMDKKDLPSAQRKAVRLNIAGKLNEPDGAPVSGTKVFVQTTQGNWTDITTRDGVFRLDILISEGEPIDFQFLPAAEKRRPAQVGWTVRVFDHDLPKGVGRVTINFLTDPSGTIRVSSIEY